MLKLLTYFVNGLIYIVLSPYYLAKYALHLLKTIIVFIGGEIITLFNFLNGKKFRNIDELSLKLETCLRQEALQKQTIQMQTIPQQNFTNGQINQQMSYPPNQFNHPYYQQPNPTQYPPQQPQYPNYNQQTNEVPKQEDKL